MQLQKWNMPEENEFKQLIRIFNQIMSEAKFQISGEKVNDVQKYGNYKDIKLMSYSIKMWKKIIKKRLREETIGSKNQFKFKPGRSITEQIFCVRQLTEKYRKKNYLAMVFTD